MGTNYSQLLKKKEDKLEKLYAILEDTKGKIKALENEINTLKVTHDAEQFGALKKDLAAKQYNVDAILTAIKDGKIDLSAYAIKPTQAPTQDTPSFSSVVGEES